MIGSWARRTLGDVLSVQNGYAFDSKAFGAAGFPLIRIRDLKEGVSTETRYGAEFDPKYVVNAGDFLIGMDGEFGCYEWKGEPALLNQRVCRLLDFAQALEPRFLFYGINAHLKAIEEVTGYTTVKHLSSKQILGIEMPVPPREEQRRIVAILDEAFEGIATAKANAEKNLQNARELFECHLRSAFEHPDPNCQQVRLGDICERVSVGHVGPTSEFYCEPARGIPFLRSQNVRPGRLSMGGLRFITEEFHRQLRKSQLRAGDLLFVRVGANRGDCCSVPEDMGDLNCANIVFARPREQVAHYLELYCQSLPGRRQLLGMTTGAAQGVINTSAVAELVVPMPPSAARRALADHLDAVAEAAAQLEDVYRRKVAALADLKASLLGQAFTGALTDKSVDKQVVEFA